MFSAHMVHEQVVEHRADGGTQAGQVVDDANPGAVHLLPWNTERQQHQEEEEGNS